MVKISVKPKIIIWGQNLDIVQDKWVNIIDGKIYDLSDGPLSDAVQYVESHSLMIPGLINAHTHIADALFKDVGWSLTLRELVEPPNGLKHLLLQKTSDAKIQNGIRHAIREMLQSGITSFSDFREGGIAGVQLLKQTLSEYAIDSQILGRFIVEKTEDWEKQNFDGFGLSSLEPYSVSFMNEVKTYTKTHQKILAWHIAERERLEDEINSTIQLKPDFVVHATHLNRKDLQQLSENKIGIVFCPRSNLMLSTGIPPLLEAIEENVPIALGTDNAFINTLDLFDELNVTLRLIRRTPKGNTIDAKKIFELVTIQAAQCIKIADRKGSLSPGKDADFCLIDLDAPNLYCREPDYFRLLANRVKSDNITKVFYKGTLVLERGPVIWQKNTI